jgi:hypothetical protein
MPMILPIAGNHLKQYGQRGLILCIVLVVQLGPLSMLCDAGTRPFTVADDIELSHFVDPDPDAETGSPVMLSPDGRFFATATERGRLDVNRPEATLRIYQTSEVQQFLREKGLPAPAAIWTSTWSSYKDGPVITHFHWLRDSTGLAFLAKSAKGVDQLVLARLNTKTANILSPENQHVTAFDIQDENNYAYTIPSPAIEAQAQAINHSAVVVGTGHSLYELMFPEDLQLARIVHDLNELWVVRNGKRFRVEDKTSGKAISLYTPGVQSFALSPNGAWIVTPLALENVPQAWQDMYKPFVPTTPVRIRAGKQDLTVFGGFNYTEAYALIDLSKGETKFLVNAPTGESAGWRETARVRVAWSSDGESVVLPSTFFSYDPASRDNEARHPCVAVANLKTGRTYCIERVRAVREDGSYEPGFHHIRNVRFDDSKRVIVDFSSVEGSKESAIYSQLADGSWSPESVAVHPAAKTETLDIAVRQSFREPPVLVARELITGRSAVLLDPNPQLKGLELDEVSVYTWKDSTGRKWKGGLYKPIGYTPGQRYPLVIQTHGFPEDEFEPSGVYPTAFAARALAAAGFMVLQAKDCAIYSTEEEGPCNVRGYEAVVDKLAADGLIDRNHVGIIGFSRSCYYVLQALTTSRLNFQAASVTDGLMLGYMQYLITLDNANNGLAQLYDTMIGARPFGEGLQQWLRRSPEFNMDKVSTPLQVVALGLPSLLEMWEPYAALRYGNKPVDLILLEEGTHILTNPAERMASQGGTVDWFRFWLQGYEDPAPAKASQYARWRELRQYRQEGIKNRVEQTRTVASH